MHDVTYPPPKPQKTLGVCIYCGDTNDLTDEHVVPFGLAKNSLVLPKASCKACAALTSLVEMGFLREGLGILREKFGAPTRRGKRRTGLASRWLVERAEDGVITPNGQLSEFRIRDLPAMCMMPVLNPAREVVAPGHRNGWTGQFWIWREDVNLPAALRPGKALHIGKINPAQFARLLAKIAHGVAVAELGLNAFRPFLRDVILKDDVDPFQYVGGAGIPDPAEGVLHAWEQGFAEAEHAGKSDARYVIVLIRLFACLGAPQYLVVAGDQELPL